MTIKRNIVYFAVTGILASLVGSYLVMAHGGHGDEEADNLGGDTAVVLSTGATFTTLQTADASNLSVPTYPGTVLSDNYGSIFPERQGIIAELIVSLGDTVKKGQRVAIINAPTNTPEMVSMIAGQRAEIAIAQGELQGAKEKFAYITNVVGGPNSSFRQAYDVQRKALDIQYEVQKKQLDAKITSLRANLEARGVVISSSQVASTATIAENTQKQETAKKYLIGKTNEAIAELLTIFYSGDKNNLGINTTSYDKYWGYNAQWGSLGVTDRQRITDIPERFHVNMKNIIPSYPLSTETTTEDLSLMLKKVETAINDANTIFSIISANTDNYAINKKELLNLLSGTDGIIILQSQLIELTNGTRSASATASGVFSQANADLIGLQQEMKLLESERDLLEANKQKDYATLSGEQSLSSVDLEKLKIEAQSEKIGAENRVKAFQNALGAIQNAMKISYAVAPFDGVISRKNVSIGQTVDVTTPLFDIAGKSESLDLFVRFEVPVSEYKSIQKGQSIQVSLPGIEAESTKAEITRFSSSVNQDTQTISVEASIDTSHLPVGTQVRIVKSGLTGTGYVEIPKTSVVEEGDKFYIYKVLPNNTLKKWKITYEIIGEKYIVTEGLKADIQIVTDIRSREWKDDMDVGAILSTNP
ncbi:efflux RND transporter periplasmic adaptor subunit [Candidatus Gracilibacteria bacterium]|nr:efflux RND transporter periplasmic adaptor subunit [Candidatus Gracilibacteria bacterium]